MGTNTGARPTRKGMPGVFAEFANLAEDLFRGIFDPYRPEQHYMRGPGPKWRAKHHFGGDFRAVPELVRVRVKR